MSAQWNYPVKHLKYFLVNKNPKTLQTKQAATVNEVSTYNLKCCLSGTKPCLVHEHSYLLPLFLTMKSESVRTFPLEL